MVSCSAFLREAANVLQTEVSESLNEQSIHSSGVGQNESHKPDAEIDTKACSADERLITFRKIFPSPVKLQKVMG